MITYTLYLKKDSKNPINKKILSHIRQNLQKFNIERNIVFKFIFIDKNNRPDHIDCCPTLSANGENIKGENIIKFLQEGKKKKSAVDMMSIDDYREKLILDQEAEGDAMFPVVDHSEALAKMLMSHKTEEKKREPIKGKYDGFIKSLEQKNKHQPDDEPQQFDMDVDESLLGKPDDFQDYARSINY